MTSVEIATLVGAFGSVVLSLSTLWMQWRKWQSAEQPASAANTDNVLTDTSLKLVTAIRAEMEQDRKSFNEEMTSMRSSLTTIRDENSMLRQKVDELEDVRDWAERLVHQVLSYGGTPVKMRQRNAMAGSK
jgi:hypothetical protein